MRIGGTHVGSGDDTDGNAASFNLLEGSHEQREPRPFYEGDKNVDAITAQKLGSELPFQRRVVGTSCKQTADGKRRFGMRPGSLLASRPNLREECLGFGKQSPPFCVVESIFRRDQFNQPVDQLNPGACL